MIKPVPSSSRFRGVRHQDFAFPHVLAELGGGVDSLPFYMSSQARGSFPADADADVDVRLVGRPVVEGP